MVCNVKVLILLFSCLLVNFSSVYGEDLLEVYHLAQENDARMRVARFSRNAVVEVKNQAKASFLPTLSLNGETSNVWVDDDDYLVRNGGSRSYNASNLTLYLQQPLFNYKNIVNYKMAHKQIAIAEAEYLKEEQGLIMRVAGTYFAMLAAQDHLAFKQAENKFLGRQTEQVKQGVAIGLSSGKVLDEVMAAYDRSHAEVIKAKNSLGKSCSALYEIINVDLNDLSGISDDLPLLLPQPPNIEYWLDIALHENRVLQSVYAEERLASLKVKDKKSGHYPTLDMTGSYIFENKGRYVDNDSDIGSIGLRLTIPIYSGGGVSSLTRQAELEHKASQKIVQQRQRAISRQIQDTYSNVIDSIEAVKALTVAILSAKSSLKATAMGLQVGSRTMVDVLNAQRDLFKVQSDYSKARLGYLYSVLALKETAGVLGLKDLEEINCWLEEPSDVAE